MLFADRWGLPRDDTLPRTWIPDAILKHRHTFYVIIFCLFALAFNGEWRIGRDSALYRGLGHALASGQGYNFGPFASRTIYPGLPVMLAGLEKVFGVNALPGILLIHLFALGALVLTYHLVRLHFPKWIAVTVTCWVGLNSLFLEFSNDLRDDIPFLCALMVALYGWERLRIHLRLTTPHLAASLVTRDLPLIHERAPQAERLNDAPHLLRDATVAKPLLIFSIGLFLCAVLRPTFWIFAVACVMVCGLGLLTGPRRRFYAVSLGMLLVVWIAAGLLDPRVRGFSPLAGGYEYQAGVGLMSAATRIGFNLGKLFDADLCYFFFGQRWLPGLTQLVTLALIASSLLLWRVNPLWTLLILLTVAVTLVWKTVPRYYVMVLPLMCLSWLLLLIEIGKRLGRRGFIVTMLIGIVTLNAMNLAAAINVIHEQRTGEMLADGPRWGAICEMARKVRAIVPPGVKVITPDATIVRYFSGRDAVMQRDIIDPKKHERHWPRHIAALGIEYAVFPGQLYDGGERRIRELMDKDVIVPTERVAYVPARDEPMVLATVKIEVPAADKDWRKRATKPTMTARTTVAGTTRPTREQIARKQRRAAAARRAAAERRKLKQAKLARAKRLERHERSAAAERKVARERKARHARRQVQRPATAPATAPSTSAAPLGRQLRYCLDPARTRVAVAFAGRRLGDGCDVGGLSGQSVALRSASISASANRREPWLMPWQRLPASFQRSGLARMPSQNGHVRHWSGRAS